MGVDTLPTPTCSWLFVERRGEEFFPVVPSSSAQDSEEEDAGAMADEFVNGPYQFRKLRANTIAKYQQRQGDAAGGDAGASDPPSPGGQQQQQQALSPGKTKGRRLRALRVQSRPGRGGRGGSSQSPLKVRYAATTGRKVSCMVVDRQTTYACEAVVIIVTQFRAAVCMQQEHSLYCCLHGCQSLQGAVGLAMFQRTMYTPCC
jgi:hypothetical protein